MIDVKPFLIVVLLITLFVSNGYPQKTETTTVNSYTIIIEGFDWGPAVSKVVIELPDSVTKVKASDFMVKVERASFCASLSEQETTGNRTVMHAYPSNSKGKKSLPNKFVTLLMYVSPFEEIGAPMKYVNNSKCNGNHWLDYHLTITNVKTSQVWDVEKERLIPTIKDFDLNGQFTFNEKLTFSYAAFKPKTEIQKVPLIIWLHGGGEGGSDVTIPLLANRAANYASPEIQAYFNGAYVLVPQCPGAWMHNKAGISTYGEKNDIYNKGLMALIKNFVNENPGIDQERIYIGGCSNGGYMTLKLMLLYPDYFAAGFPSALAYNSEFLTDEQIDRIKHLPVWFIHSKDDAVTPPNETVVPIYKRLKEAGATKVHFSYFNNVVDITGLFGGNDFHYNGHLSWIYSHTNKCQLNYEGKPVMVNGQALSLMSWLALQGRKK